MSENCLVINIDRCINCLSCEIACQINHNISPGTSRLQVLKRGPAEEGGKLILDYVPLVCLQCKDSYCVDSCRHNAIVKENGYVYIDSEACRGCKECIFSCPYGLIFYDEARKKAEKCDLCRGIEKERPPYCVANCWGGALMWIPLAKLSETLICRDDGTKKRVVYISQRRIINELDY